VATLERPVDRGTRLGRASIARIGQDIRDARQDRGLPIQAVAGATGLSPSEVSRIERGRVAGVPLLTLSRLSGAVGLDLVTREYPGPRPIRDASQAELLGGFRDRLHRSIRWATEVPLPIRGDQRAWDAVITGYLTTSGERAPGGTWRYGIEAETSPRDAQALLRRTQLKHRDGGLDGFLIVMPDSRHTRTFCRAASVEISEACPISGARALELLRAGLDPGGNAVILLPRSRGEARGGQGAGAPSKGRAERVASDARE
jgi:transcriptional regulator with XRE-family HTH domain